MAVCPMCQLGYSQPHTVEDWLEAFPPDEDKPQVVVDF